MSSEAAITVRGLGKAYRIARRRDGGDRRDTGLLEKLRTLRGATDPFWALRDVSFDVASGEVLGVIGRNGAGKSTLLKILSRITEPTAGEAVLRGRTGSLLEVGTGFHRELTGRENIYLNGAMLGMNRSEIDRHFDEIVAFSGVERFLETPVKRYSSGMFVRLAFAVAAHLRAEILVVDEVLAVGDVGFQARCLDKMRDVTEEGRTVLFVSHNMGTMKSLCRRCMLLDDGRVAALGGVNEVVQAYLDRVESEGRIDAPLAGRAGTGSVEMRAVRLLDEEGRTVTRVVGGRDVVLEIDYVRHADATHPKLIANLYAAGGESVSSFSTPYTAPELGRFGATGTLRCRLHRLPLVPGRYRIALALHADGQAADTLKAAVVFDVVSTTFHPTGAAPDSGTATVMLDHAWTHDAPSRGGAETHTPAPRSEA